VRISFQAHGSHRKMQSTYAHLRQAGLFREIAANAASATTPTHQAPQSAPATHPNQAQYARTQNQNPTSPDFTAHRIPNPT